ncbi:AraC family transcriptional regulator [Tenacibaculum sp. IB213877]|uniref:helix-turn-helix domain-containing protein n=1 Tax=Tenacibaculum sp. IB213877 TaxID=3097351 RepID=UPI002A5ABA25|nr:AraC family transcriptional regulator [Tenacibaculum sp. IB213877]MDY0780116.1 AraC family transcriptional regulator [Tenacibaculum sp. IB213877]
MKSISINSISISRTFTQLSEQLNGSYKKCFKEHCLKLNNEIGYGEIRGMLLKGGLFYLEFNVTFEEDVELTIQSNNKPVVNFAYCSEGTVAHQFSKDKKETTIQPFQTTIISNIETSNNRILFKKHNTVNLTLITAYNFNEQLKPNTVQKQLFERFVENKSEDYVFIGSHNLEIAEKIQELNSIKHNGVVRSLIIEGTVHIVLALEIQQYKRDLKNIENNIGTLTAKEMEEIKEISDFIKNYPEEATSVIDLCKKTGLSSAKLQEGFKMMHKTTVNDFIRDERIRKSEKLIKTTDLNISEIVYTIGFSSRSYFCKIFKQKYNCTPMEYKSKTKLAATA